MHHRPHLGNGYRLSAASITTAANTDATTCPSAAVSALLLVLLLLLPPLLDGGWATDRRSLTKTAKLPPCAHSFDAILGHVAV